MIRFKVILRNRGTLVKLRSLKTSEQIDRVKKAYGIHILCPTNEDKNKEILVQQYKV